MKVNNVLLEQGLTGCFNFLHSLVLTNKVQTLFKQAVDLARGLWSDVLRVELLHRTLIVQYWASKPGTKSWIEIGIRSGRQIGSHGSIPERGVPYLGLRWMHDGKEVDSGDVQFDTGSLSMECVLRSVIALHTSHILASAYTNLNETLLFSTGQLSLQAQLSTTEPGNCELGIQFTRTRQLRVSVEPMSGASVLSANPNVLERPENDRGPDKSSIDDIIARVSRLRCTAAIEEIESNMKMLGFETVNARRLRLDVRKIFPSNVLRFSFFWHRLWERNWILAATSSMDSDNWWLVQLGPAVPSQPISRSNTPLDAGTNLSSTIRSAQSISDTLHPAQQPLNYTSFADLGHCLSGILAVHANAHYLSELHCIDFYPPLQRLQVEPGLQVPDLFIRYGSANLPSALRMALPGGLKKKSFIKNTIRVAFHGIDAHTGAAIMVAYGNFSISVKTLGTLIPKFDDERSLVFQQTGSGFALRLLAPVGRSVIIDLIRTLQKLECVLSIIESIQQKNMAPQSLSLSHIAFAYNPEENSYAVIHVQDIGPLSKGSIDPTEIAPEAGPLFPLRLSISFDRLTPHRRIQESLTAVLNESSDAGFDSGMELLSLTLPLLRAFDRVAANPSRKEPLKVQITVRNANTFLIHYPGNKYRFQLTAGQYLNRMAWILRDVSGGPEKAAHAQLAGKLQEGLYNSKGDGWRGLGNGVVAEAEKVGNLLSELHKYFGPVQDVPAAVVVGGQLKLASSADNKTAPGRAIGPGSNVDPTASLGTASQNPQRKPAPKNPEPIVIE